MKKMKRALLVATCLGAAYALWVVAPDAILASITLIVLVVITGAVQALGPERPRRRPGVDMGGPWRAADEAELKRVADAAAKHPDIACVIGRWLTSAGDPLRVYDARIAMACAETMERYEGAQRAIDQLATKAQPAGPCSDGGLPA